MFDPRFLEYKDDKPRDHHRVKPTIILGAIMAAIAFSIIQWLVS